jgi:hypothetical protein
MPLKVRLTVLNERIHRWLCQSLDVSMILLSMMYSIYFAHRRNFVSAASVSSAFKASAATG